ncbi:LuxR C-terminal-related transcriptional regulator [Ottowia sp.]|uniref:helix-turn-helix transcriptional regulator n=1 Tax=Ottowia sp. TaxID=1898956 RepID=UPI0025DD6C75|nr:LuxR C-terminal-related transcriptional regulator [Ottowia sp.]MBK6616393.1 autoinducer binding domain-containing protein [Ottowia sp.]
MKQQDYLDISLAPDRGTFEARLVEFAQRLDFGIISGSLVVEEPGRPVEFIPVGNTPQAFIEAHRSLDNSLRDPVLKRLKRMSVPFTYTQQMYVDEGSADLWDLQAQFGYRTGISMALHLPEGKHFLLGVDRDKPLPKSDTVLTRMMADLQLLAVHAQGAAVRLFTPDRPLTGPVQTQPVPKLTPNECAVLRWTMEGKSASVTGQILGMSKHTVVFHLRNAREKLQVSSKHQAVFKAVNLGLI